MKSNDRFNAAVKSVEDDLNEAKRRIDNGEPFNTTAADMGYTPVELRELLGAPVEKVLPKSLAEQLLFNLQFMGIMGMAGRQDQRDSHFVKCQELAQQLIDAGH